MQKIRLGSGFPSLKFAKKSNRAVPVKVTTTDGYGNAFVSNSTIPTSPSSPEFTTLSSEQLRDMFESFNVDVEIEGEKQTLQVESGVGDTIVKEEWRGEHVCNVFYPATGGPFKVIIHTNGGVSLMQDARSQMLANLGYLVVEVGYNLPQYGQELIFFRKQIELEYFEAIIKRALKHDKAYGDEVCFIGHSKGADLALFTSVSCPELVSLTICSSGGFNAPVFTDSTYGNRRFPNAGNHPVKLLDFAHQSDDGLMRLRGPHGLTGAMSLAYHYQDHPLYIADSFESGYYLNPKALEISRTYPFPNPRKMLYFMTLDDPIVAPTREMMLAFMNEFTDHLPSGVEVELLEAGHLYVLPDIPVCNEAVMKFGDIKLLLDWSWNTSDEDRLKEAAVYRHVWKRIQQMLSDHF
ncbi:Oidioi.mRNA.OKI2018_I69.chr1.g806.t1.cds [Oikopleura dioica]|uniref:Oidioi.mRNA.OKI2018_I69.chr1.g806.t1.cds n=1 Tax=Oikopleura dioica TaxID=34765 RepID=A0ABN7SV81_OIKDI|nr:Oidioi.mRNA.OKI2018_I69.chr1.g806.t1.cds [Oikopleura dioica]